MVQPETETPVALPKCASCKRRVPCEVIQVWSFERPVCESCQRLPQQELEQRCFPVLNRLRRPVPC